jgi:hypothetical protein
MDGGCNPVNTIQQNSAFVVSVVHFSLVYHVYCPQTNNPLLLLLLLLSVYRLFRKFALSLQWATTAVLFKMT